MHKRIVLTFGLLMYGIFFMVTGYSNDLRTICIGLIGQGISCSLSFIPTFPEMIASARYKYSGSTNSLNNLAAGIMNSGFFFAGFAHLLSGFTTKNYGFPFSMKVAATVSVSYAVFYFLTGNGRKVICNKDLDEVFESINPMNF